ncbi:MAG: chemotaxis protein CheA [Burkholderiales bacterium]|nr:chemotaxis protein CheA [Burkholderiales bacterium]
MSEADEIYSVFAHEAQEQLRALEEGLLGLEQGDEDVETLNAIFRAAHTLKGAAGVVELVHIEAFTHVLENLLDQLRNGKLAIGGGMVTTLLRGCDHLAALLRRVDQGALDLDDELRADGRALVTALEAYVPAVAAAAGAESAEAVALAAGADTVSSDCWHISVRFGRDVLRKGMEPLAFLRYLLSLGEITHLTTLADAMPQAEEMDPESCYLGFEIDLRSSADKAAVENVFDFVREDCDLYILPPHSQVSDFLRLIEALPEETLKLGEILQRSGALTADELERGLRTQREMGAVRTGGADGEGAATGIDGAARGIAQDAASREGAVTGAGTDAGTELPNTPLGQILVQQKVVQAAVVDAAAAKQKAVAERRAGELRLIRVHADKLDQLIDLVGELVIAGASSNLLAQRSGQSELVESTSVLSRLVENIRDAALQLRMVQIGETFNRFPRVVRDVSKELGKDIELVISGAETELDKSVVEKIGDPLMHLVRNAMDHGIEPEEVRIANGKPARGRLELNAYHDSGSIVIEVSDDGGGLDRERILAKAIERGIVSAGQSLSDHEVNQLIFEPGFSTAEKITNLSGRGVGMDVVRRNIQALRGSVDVSTVPGQGSCFTIRLPLTLAIIDGFLVGVGKASYAIPLEMVVECLEGQSIGAERNYLDLRGEVLPFVRLRELFEVPGTPPARQNVVVMKTSAGKLGVVVDVLHGEFQTVIKPLSPLFRQLRGIVGSTIMGSGEVALILDVQTLAQLAIGAQGMQGKAIAAEAIQS